MVISTLTPRLEEAQKTIEATLMWAGMLESSPGRSLLFVDIGTDICDKYTLDEFLLVAKGVGDSLVYVADTDPVKYEALRQTPIAEGYLRVLNEYKRRESG